MANLQNRLTAYMRMITIFIFLWENIFVMVRPEDDVDGGYRRVSVGGDETPFKVPLPIDRHFDENVWELKPVNVITTVLDIETPDDYNPYENNDIEVVDKLGGRKSHHSNGERKRGMHITEEKSNAQGIQKMIIVYTAKKPRFLCLHGYMSNAAKFKTYFNVWPESVTENMDLIFINAPFRVYVETDDDEHYEWFTSDKVNTEYDNFEEGISYIEDRMIELGPFDGVLGFSQGAVVAGALPGMQKQGVCLTKVGKIEHVVIISGAKLGGKAFPQPKLAETAYSFPINIPSLHIFGETDIARANAPELVEAYVDPLVIYHHGGHEVPTLDEHGLKIMFKFLKRINAIV